MDLTTIAAAAGVALVPYLVKGGEKLAEKPLKKDSSSGTKSGDLSKVFLPKTI